MDLWKKKPAPQQHHERYDDLHNKINSLQAQIDHLAQKKTEKNPTICTLDADENVLVSCLADGGEIVFVPLSQLSSQIQQAMLVSLSAKTSRASRSAKSAKPQPAENE